MKNLEEPPSSTSSPSHPSHPFSSDNARDIDNISTKRKINKQNSTSTSSSSSERNDSSQEIAGGNCLDSKGEKSDEKINTPKKRFFDLKRTAESASNRISSLSPSRLAKSLTPRLRRKNASSHKLSQLERQSNLFIRDGSEISKHENLTMENGTDGNAKHQQNLLEGNSENIQKKAKKSSLISSFNFKIPSASATNKKLCKNFPEDLKSSAEASSDAFGNYEEIDIVDENENEDVKRERQDMITNAPDALNDKESRNCTKATSETDRKTIGKFPPEEKPKDENGEEEEFNSIESCGDGEPLDVVLKPEFSSNLFKNIPVRARKGQVPHMDNYCLFDPSVDFCNEKEMRKKSFPTQFHLSSQNFFNCVQRNVPEQQLNTTKTSIAHHNYYEIDPELLEQDENAATNVEGIPRPPEQISRKSSSSSSSDYPLHSIIETTPSSTVTIESTDENETVACRRLNNEAAPNIPTSNAINQTNVELESDENEITISSNVTATGAKKKSPQIDRIVKQAARNSPDNANQQPTSSGKSTRINLPFYYKTLSFDPLKASHSLPQLQNITVRQEQTVDGDYNIELCNRTTIQLRKSVRQVRPLSSDSLDSGFTTPSPPNEIPSARNLSSGDKSQVDNLNSGTKEPVKIESTVLTQCENIQQLIEVSNEHVHTQLG